jgi:hypothetical protein
MAPTPQQQRPQSASSLGPGHQRPRPPSASKSPHVPKRPTSARVVGSSATKAGGMRDPGALDPSTHDALAGSSGLSNVANESTKLILPRSSKAKGAENSAFRGTSPGTSDFVPPSPKGMQKFMQMYYTDHDIGEKFRLCTICSVSTLNRCAVTCFQSNALIVQVKKSLLVCARIHLNHF